MKKSLVSKRYTIKEHKLPEVEFEGRHLKITDAEGNIIWEKENVQFPKHFSHLASNIAGRHYLNKKNPEETSIAQTFDRVVGRLKEWGIKGKYFNEKDAVTFGHELYSILIHQKASFNSPVYYNIGLPGRKQQGSACFLQSVDDSIDGIMTLAKNQATLFKGGSGTGSNLSNLRSKYESLAQGGTASGPLSFMRMFDAVGATMKSGGKTRRSAALVLLNADHPEIEDFIDCKMLEEKKAHALIDAGYDSSFNGEAYNSVCFQNANHSVRATDEFMEAVIKDETWDLKYVTTGKTHKTIKAKKLFEKIAEAAWTCGDPGMLFDTTINKWHTIPNSGRINTANPCTEYMSIDDTACNLGSLNLIKFLQDDGTFDTDEFQHVVRIMTLAMEIIVGGADYPTKIISKNSKMVRTLGLGFANLGAMLMKLGLPYDSDNGRSWASNIMSLLSSTAYLHSCHIAEQVGAFDEFSKNENEMLGVIAMHSDKHSSLSTVQNLTMIASNNWKQCLKMICSSGIRNSQISVLAPTGTISMLMDCDTTGMEPDISLVKYKTLAGGGNLKMANSSIGSALRNLGYIEIEIEDILSFIKQNDSIENAPHIQTEHLPIFDCALKPKNGKRFIKPLGHIKMLAALQPFVSGSLSKTINCPNETTKEEIMDMYIESWKLGLKAVAIYRDGSKKIQPLNLKKSENNQSVAPKVLSEAVRKKLPRERKSTTVKMNIGGSEFYMTIGLYDDGKPGEVFFIANKQGSTVGGFIDCMASTISLALQYGVPLKTITNKFKATRFEPAGFTNDPDIHMATSFPDFVAKYLEKEFLTEKDEKAEPVECENFKPDQDAPLCTECGGQTRMSGSCHLCVDCGTSTSCG